jgi:tyrosyl-tRNA synthetase
VEGEGMALVELLACTGLSSSRSDARRTVAQRGASVNNRQQDDVDRRLTTADLLHDQYVVLRRGRRDHHLVRFR